MANEFKATHEINLTNKRDGERKPSIYVQLVDGCAYTEQEWANTSHADWEHSDETGWTFQGRTTPHDDYTVSVRTLPA